MLDRIPGKERKAILKSELKKDIPRLKSIPGFRSPDLAPPHILKGWLKNEEKFWVLFVNDTAARYGCSVSKYPTEKMLPELTAENFWGIFAWNCFQEDSSPESCSKLSQMLEQYEMLLRGEEMPQQEGRTAEISENPQSLNAVREDQTEAVQRVDAPAPAAGGREDTLDKDSADAQKAASDHGAVFMTETASEAQPESAPASIPEIVSEMEGEPDAIQELASEVGPEPVRANTPEMVSEAELAPAPTITPEIVFEAEPEPAPIITPEMVSEADMMPAPASIPEIISEAEPKPVPVKILETISGDSEPEDVGGLVSGTAAEAQNQTEDIKPEELRSKERQFIGYVQETNGYYNFWPACLMQDGMAKPLHVDDIREAFPDLGNINLSSTPWDYIRKKCSNGEILVITLYPSDYMENRKTDGFFQRTNYKVDFYQLERQGRIKHLSDIQMYPVLHPVGIIDFSKKAVLVRENFVDVKDMCMLEEGNRLYGPYRVASDEDGRTQVNLTNKDIVDSYRPKSGTIEYTEISIDVPGCMRLGTGYVHLDDSLVREQQDKISDPDLFKLFQRSLAGRKNSEKFPITPDQIDQYTTSIFYGLPDEISQSRIARIKSFFEEQFKQEDVQEDLAQFMADLFYKYGESGYFSNLLERILDNSELANKIQTFAIVKQRISEMQQQYEQIRQQCRQERIKLDEETADREKQISQMAEKTSEEIQDLTARRDELLAEVAAVQRQLSQLDRVINLDRERERLEAVNDNLRETECRLRERGDEAVKILQDKLRQATENAVATAFDGKIADQVFKAAANWRQSSQDAAFNEIAGKLTVSGEGDVLRGYALREYLLTSVKRCRPDYSNNEILNLFICVAQNFLTVFCGEPGSGKTSICNIIAHVLGTAKTADLVSDTKGIEISRYVPISVERGWTSKRDWIGYYNPLSQSFEKANRHLYDGLRLLNAEGERSQYPYMVLLDEASLSPIEYYWADFMNMCDQNGGCGKIALGDDLQMQIPPTLRFTATINSDDTTERLSPRLIDRAAVIALPDVRNTRTEEQLPDSVLPVRWDAFQETFHFQASDEMDSMPSEIYEEICKVFGEEMRIGISSRTDRAVRKYWAAAKELFESEDGKDATIIALDYAVAQKLLPRINGSGDSYLKLLEKLEGICGKNNLAKCEKSLQDIIKRGKVSMSYYQYF